MVVEIPGWLKVVVCVAPVVAPASTLIGVVVLTPEKEEMPPALPAEALNVHA